MRKKIVCFKSAAISEQQLEAFDQLDSDDDDEIYLSGYIAAIEDEDTAIERAVKFAKQKNDELEKKNKGKKPKAKKKKGAADSDEVTVYIPVVFRIELLNMTG